MYIYISICRYIYISISIYIYVHIRYARPAGRPQTRAHTHKVSVTRTLAQNSNCRATGSDGTLKNTKLPPKKTARAVCWF